MATIHWVNEAGDAEAQPVCTADFGDSGMAVDFAHTLYRAVHGHGRSKSGFAIKNADGEIVYAWRWDADAAEIASAEERAVAPAPEQPRESPADEAAPLVADADGAQALARPQRLPDEAATEPSGSMALVALHRLERGLRATSGIFSLGVARLAAFARRVPAASPPLPKKTVAAGPFAARRFAPTIARSDRRRKPSVDHYLLAIIAILAVLCGSPLYSVYSTLQRFQKDAALVQVDKADGAAHTRAAVIAALSTDGQLDFRKLFWHLRLVGPNQIDLLAFDPAEGGEGPRFIFKTNNLLRWHLRSVRGADGTWVA